MATPTKTSDAASTSRFDIQSPHPSRTSDQPPARATRQPAKPQTSAPAVCPVSQASFDISKVDSPASMCPALNAIPAEEIVRKAETSHETVPRAVMTEEEIRLVKATAPVFKEHGVKITKHFYEKVFTKVPALNNVFNAAHQKTGQQSTALANAVFAYAANIDNLGALGPAVSLISHKHASLGILPEHYPIVGENLLESVVDILGDAVDQATLNAWKVAYQQLANVLIGAEEQLYKAAEAKEGGWRGWRKFYVSDKKFETEEMDSIYLKPEDKGRLPNFFPGQFVCIKSFVEAIGYEQPRQYSLSSAPNPDYLRVTVKRASASNKGPAGLFSNLVHGLDIGTVVDVSSPFGTFFLDTNAKTPVVLISGGSGVTPMISMLEYLVDSAPDRDVVFIHSTQSAKTHAMREFVSEAVTKHPRIKSLIWYGGKAEDHPFPHEHTHNGRINLNEVKDDIFVPSADFYVCGPVQFMESIEGQLVALGVGTKKIHSEEFGVKVSA